LAGIVEGYYGRTWSAQTRLDYATYLSRAGLNACLYCPKADPYLRKHWQRDWPSQEWAQLSSLAATYRAASLSWGVGLSPFALYRQYGNHEREQLRRKIGRLSELDAPLLAVLFDDMPGDLDALATRQAEIVADVVDWLPGVRILVCPTYYSHDPVLEQHFGRMPAHYWPDLGANMPPAVDIFWTGNKVCSDTIAAADIAAICAELGRPVVLWDNYPVNDGAVRSNFLYCSELAGREALAPELVAGHFCNPMNQALLSLPALTGLARLYRRGPDDDGWLEEVMGSATWAQLQRDQEAFARLGLSGLGAARRDELAAVYRKLPGPAAHEVAAWLAGDYTFDPACLTD
jgi:hypothetical protein